MTDTLTVLNAMKEYYSPDGDTQELLPMCEAACRELADYAQKEKTEALAAAAPLLRDEEFHFGQVKV